MTDGERDIHLEQERDARESEELSGFRCAFCGMRPDDEEAEDFDDWAHYFFLSEEEDSGKQACPPCAETHLDDLLDDPILKRGHAKFIKY
jgi:hypothetical protein